MLSKYPFNCKMKRKCYPYMPPPLSLSLLPSPLSPSPLPLLSPLPSLLLLPMSKLLLPPLMPLLPPLLPLFSLQLLVDCCFFCRSCYPRRHCRCCCRRCSCHRCHCHCCHCRCCRHCRHCHPYQCQHCRRPHRCHHGRSRRRDCRHCHQCRCRCCLRIRCCGPSSSLLLVQRRLVTAVAFSGMRGYAAVWLFPFVVVRWAAGGGE